MLKQKIFLWLFLLLTIIPLFLIHNNFLILLIFSYIIIYYFKNRKLFNKKQSIDELANQKIEISGEEFLINKPPRIEKVLRYVYFIYVIGLLILIFVPLLLPTGFLAPEKKSSFIAIGALSLIFINLLLSNKVWGGSIGWSHDNKDLRPIFIILGLISISLFLGLILWVTTVSLPTKSTQTAPITDQLVTQDKESSQLSGQDIVQLASTTSKLQSETAVSIIDLKIYKNDQYGFEFQYPANLNLLKNEQPGNGFFQINSPNIFEFQRYPYVNNQPNSSGVYTVSLPIIQIFLSRDGGFSKGKSIDPEVLKEVDILKNIELTVELTCFNKQYPPPSSEGLPLDQDGLLDKPRQTIIYQYRFGYAAETCQRLKLTPTNNILCLNLYANTNNLNDSKDFLDKILPTLKINQNFDSLNIKCEGSYF